MKKILFTCVMFLLMTMTTFAQTNTDIAALQAKAQAGNTDAMWQLGIHYFKSDGRELSKNAGLWLNQAYSKDSNNAMGLYYLGLWYGIPSTKILDTENREHYIPRDEKKAYNLFKRSANLGCIEAMVVYLRALYISNKNPTVIVPVSKNERNKFKQIILAAAQKPEADFMLLTEAAQYVPELEDENSVYVIKAIETNPDKALTLLTEKIYRYYGDSLLFAKFADDETFIKANGITPKIQYNTASWLWKRGRTERGDAINGFRLFEKSANSGFAPAQNQMGCIYKSGEVVVQKDTLKALQWFQKAMDNGNYGSILWVARQYQLGRYLPKNLEKAFVLFRKAVEMKDSTLSNVGRMYVAECYYEGKGTAVDYDKAFYYLCKAKESEPLPTMHENILGECYYYGRGTAVNFDKAFSCFQNAATGHDGYAPYSVAMKNLAKCYFNGRGVAIDEEKARYWMKKAAEAKDGDAVTLMSNEATMKLLHNP